MIQKIHAKDPNGKCLQITFKTFYDQLANSAVPDQTVLVSLLIRIHISCKCLKVGFRRAQLISTLTEFEHFKTGKRSYSPILDTKDQFPPNKLFSLTGDENLKHYLAY